MIAAGLCMMGGCFAQDAATQAVETYWPAHSVAISSNLIMIKDYGDDLLLPVVAEGLRAGARAENIVSLATSPANVNFFAWGYWVSTVRDAMYVGIDGGKPYCRYITDQQSSGPCLSLSVWPIQWQELEVNRRGMLLRTEKEEAFLDFPSVDAQEESCPWSIRINATSYSVDVVSYWWVNDVINKSFFLVLPMCSPAGSCAFYTLGFNILTEL